MCSQAHTLEILKWVKFYFVKSGSWALVDACNFFGGSLIRIYTESFGNVSGNVS